MKRIKTGGRKKNTPNRITKDIKEAYKLLIENNIDKMQGWIDDIAVKDPAKAIQIFCELSEYVVPKLARSEMDLKNKFFNIESIRISYESMNEGETNEYIE